MEKRVSPFRIYFRQQFLSEKWDNLSFELSDICRFYLVTYGKSVLIAWDVKGCLSGGSLSAFDSSLSDVGDEDIVIFNSFKPVLKMLQDDVEGQPKDLFYCLGGRIDDTERRKKFSLNAVLAKHQKDGKLPFSLDEIKASCPNICKCFEFAENAGEEFNDFYLNRVNELIGEEQPVNDEMEDEDDEQEEEPQSSKRRRVNGGNHIRAKKRKTLGFKKKLSYVSSRFEGKCESCVAHRRHFFSEPKWCNKCMTSVQKMLLKDGDLMKELARVCDLKDPQVKEMLQTGKMTVASLVSLFENKFHDMTEDEVVAFGEEMGDKFLSLISH